MYLFPEDVAGSSWQDGSCATHNPHPAKGFASGLRQVFGALLLTLSKRPEVQDHAKEVSAKKNEQKFRVFFYERRASRQASAFRETVTKFQTRPALQTENIGIDATFPHKEELQKFF